MKVSPQPLSSPVVLLPPLASCRWEIDEFEERNAGLVVAEVELDSADQAIDLPPWAGEEVTDVDRYYNVALAVEPFDSWPPS